MKRALVLSGGGAKLSYQAGALKALQSRGFRSWEAIAGVSAGGIVAAMVAQGRMHDLERLALEIRADDVYRGGGRLGMALRIIGGSTSLADHKPLYKLLKRVVDVGRIARPETVSVGLTEWETGAYRRIQATEPDFVRAIWAGATMPGIWPPVKWRHGFHAVDGGLKNMVPLADVLWCEPGEIVVIALRQKVDKSIPGPMSVLSTLGRSLEIMTGEIARQDLAGPAFVNDLVAQAEKHSVQLWHPGRARWLVPYRLRVIRPSHDLGDTLDFSADTQERRFQAGVDDALASIDADPPAEAA